MKLCKLNPKPKKAPLQTRASQGICGVTAKFSSASCKFWSNTVIFVYSFYKHCTARKSRAEVIQMYAEVLQTKSLLIIASVPVNNFHVDFCVRTEWLVRIVCEPKAHV